ncbi:hypothetical protein KJ564_16190 [bacterium]|nr:hypothetical protein [bacterium]MBU1881569.1 hypothetical protein [bacterium]
MSYRRSFENYIVIILRILLLWIIIGLMIWVGIELGIDTKIIGAVVAIFGFFTNAFTGMMTLIALIPFIGPLIIKIVSLPVFWIINGIGYILSVGAVRAGYTKEIINYRVLTIVFLLGMVLGFIVGRIV